MSATTVLTRGAGDLGWGLDGQALHHETSGVPPECWCVTRQDLRHLRRLIREAVAEGIVRPIPLDPATGKGDPFDPKDNAVGPSMHNVVASLIKPLTERAGKMSWALLRHPEGLRCDLFITHCWAEGAYEFIDKVLKSWPSKKRHAWCCILANPQNLDISHLVREPRTSPFAQALQCASHMMVVSTRRCSIYTRIWCAYEAYLAYTLGKTIFMASAPVGCKGWLEFASTLLCAIGGVALGWCAFAACDAEEGALAVPAAVSLCMALASQVFMHSPGRVLLINDLGMATAGFLLGSGLPSLGPAQVCKPWRTHFAFIGAMMAGYFIFSELDRLRGVRVHLETEQLRSSFSSINEAEASNEEDKHNILREIGYRRRRVDDSIRVILAAGMSTPALRKAAHCGTDITNMADLRYSLLWLVFAVPICFQTPMQVQFRDLFQVVLQPKKGSHAAGICASINRFSFTGIYLVVYMRHTVDRRAFMVSLAFKMRWVLKAIAVCIILVGSHATEDEAAREVFALCVGASETAVLLGCSLAGPHHVARLPRVGPWLAAALGPGRWCCCCCGWRRRRWHGTASSEAAPAEELAAALPVILGAAGPVKAGP